MRAKPWQVLGAIFLVAAGANALWVVQDQTLRAYDMGPHIEAAARAHDVVRTEGLSGALRVLRGHAAGWWPSAGYLPWTMLSLVFGHSVTALRLFNLLYLALLLWAVFDLGRSLRSERAGLVAAALVLLYPGVYGESRQFGLDFPGAALVALCMALLLRTRCLSRRGAAAWLGLATGAAVLVRPQSAFFLAVPGLLAVVAGLYRPPAGSRARVLVNTALALGLAAGTSGVWWFGRVGEIAAALGSHRSGWAELPAAEHSALVEYLLVGPLCFSAFGLFVAGLMLPWHAMAVRADVRQGGLADAVAPLLLWAWLVSGLTFLSLLHVTSLRYLLPLCPPLALISAHGLVSAGRHRGPWARRVGLGLALGAAATLWLLDSFIATSPLPVGLGSAHPAHLFQLHVTSGPPARDPIVLAAQRMADQLRRRHPRTREVAVRMLCPPQEQPTARPRRCGVELQLRWITAAVLAAELPGVVLDPERLGSDGWYRPIEAAAVPLGRAAVKQCYTLVFSHPDTSADHGGRLIFETRFNDTTPYTPHSRPRPLRASLWLHQDCAEVRQ